MKAEEFTVDGKKYCIKKPNSKVNQEAQRRYSIELHKCLREGVMPKKKLKQFLIEHEIWSDEKDKEEQELVDKINKLEFELYRGGGKGRGKKKINKKVGREKSLEMRQLRSQYVELISERNTHEANTAESLADDARFDFLVSQCTFNEDGTKVYNSYEEYIEKSDEELAYKAAFTLSKMMFALEDDFASKLPENRFLSMFGMVDDQNRLINEDGHLVDSEYRLINEEGQYVDADGNRVDKEGNSLTDDGFFDLEVTYVDDDGNPITPKSQNETEESEEAEEETTE